MELDCFTESRRLKTLKTAFPTDAEYWRVEHNLLVWSAVRAAAFFAVNSQGFSERWARRGGVDLLALAWPFLGAFRRTVGFRLVHALLRGVSRDRLDLLGEEYFHYHLKPRIRPDGAEKLREARSSGRPMVLVSHGLDHVVRPLADFLGAQYILCNRLEFRDGITTGRLLEPIVPPRGTLERLFRQRPEGRVSPEEIASELRPGISSRLPDGAVIPAGRQPVQKKRPLVLFQPYRPTQRLSVKEALARKNVLLIGVTGFIGKVWLVQALSDIPEIGRLFLLIRRQRSVSAIQRFEKMVEESPVFEGLEACHGDNLARFIRERVEVLEGDVSQPGLGLEPSVQARLFSDLDLIVNSSGLTDFNPDLRTALTINVEGTLNTLAFLRQCRHAALLHLSTCFVAGDRDGRVSEELRADYTPAHVADFDPQQEYQALHALVREIEASSESTALTEELRQQVRERTAGPKELEGSSFENHLKKYRNRWVRSQMIEAGMRRARELGWPNTYTFTKSLAESLIAKLGADLPIAVVRPSIVETSTRQPFRGWNEGVNTSAPLSYLLGTFFRQLPSNKRKRLDLIPVDLVTRGMMLISAALIERRHERLYQLATSAVNPCDMRRSIELTGLAHRKHYRAQEGLEHWLRARFDTIPVSKARYQKLSAPRQKAMVRAIRRTLPFARSPLIRKERDLERVEKLIELYEPFILQNEHVFEAQNIELLSRALPPEEKEVFGYDPDSIDWWEYWINIHIPALRKWSYPLIEGRAIEFSPRRVFRMPENDRTAQGDGAVAIRKPTGTEATWRSS
jgi:thioester reductase-like protein/phosphoserine phosphatase